MAMYYPHRRYGSSYGMYEQDKYPGYDTSWVLGRNRLSGYDDDYYYGTNYYTPGYSSYDHHPRFVSQQPFHNRDRGLILPHDVTAEIPVRLRATICCQQCKLKLSKALRNMHGVHDVIISGWEPALVTVTGTASARKILKKVRKNSLHAEWSIDSAYPTHRAGWSTAY